MWRRMVGSLVLTMLSASSTEGTLRVHFIDVGQGDAALLEFPCGTMLIDTGGEATTWKHGQIRRVFGGGSALAGYLQGFFNAKGTARPRLDLLLLTHPHVDHTTGVPNVLEAFRPRNIVYNDESRGTGYSEQKLARELAEASPDIDGWYVTEQTIPDGTGLTNATIDPIDCGATDPKIRVLWGSARNDSDWHPSEYKNGNNHSVVVRVDYGQASILFTGDLEETEKNRKAGIERVLEKYAGTDLLDVDVLQLGHHGSANGNSDALVDAVSPAIAVLSHGPECSTRRGHSAWSYRHPRMETINELLGCTTSGASCLSSRTPHGVRIYDKRDGRWGDAHHGEGHLLHRMGRHHRPRSRGEWHLDHCFHSRRRSLFMSVSPCSGSAQARNPNQVLGTSVSHLT